MLLPAHTQLNALQLRLLMRVFFLRIVYRQGRSSDCSSSGPGGRLMPQPRCPQNILLLLRHDDRRYAVLEPEGPVLSRIVEEGVAPSMPINRTTACLRGRVAAAV